MCLISFSSKEENEMCKGGEDDGGAVMLPCLWEGGMDGEGLTPGLPTSPAAPTLTSPAAAAGPPPTRLGPPRTFSVSLCRDEDAHVAVPPAHGLSRRLLLLEARACLSPSAARLPSAVSCRLPGSCEQEQGSQ